MPVYIINYCCMLLRKENVFKSCKTVIHTYAKIVCYSGLRITELGTKSELWRKLMNKTKYEESQFIQMCLNISAILLCGKIILK
jgi:hypothetical protein